MTASVVLSGCEALTLVSGGWGAEERWRQALMIKAAAPVLPPAPPPALPSLSSLAVDVAIPNHLYTSGQGRRPQQEKDRERNFPPLWKSNYFTSQSTYRLLKTVHPYILLASGQHKFKGKWLRDHLGFLLCQTSLWLCHCILRSQQLWWIICQNFESKTQVEMNWNYPLYQNYVHISNLKSTALGPFHKGDLWALLTHTLQMLSCSTNDSQIADTILSPTGLSYAHAKCQN